MGFSKFMASGAGRLLRIVAGAALIVIGLWLVGGIWGIVITVVGLVPLVAGLTDVCLLGTLFFRTPLRGRDIRAA